MLAITFTAVYRGAIYVPYTSLAPLLEGRMSLGRNGVTAALVVCGLGAVAGNRAGGWVADRLGSFRTLLGLAGAQAPVALALHAACICVGAAAGATMGGWVVVDAGLQALGVAGGLMALLAVTSMIASHHLSPVDTRPART